MSISGFFQFVLGFILGVGILSGSAAGVAYMLFSRMTVTPDRPVFPEEEKVVAKATDQPAIEATEAEKTVFDRTKAVESNYYRARIIWPQGLVLRAGPGGQSGRIGGLAFNSEVIVLEYSQDNEWQKVRIPQTNQIGWIKSGNIEKID